MTINPILALELRQRWRNARSFLLLFGVALALSLLTGFIYERAVSYGSGNGDSVITFIAPAAGAPPGARRAIRSTPIAGAFRDNARLRDVGRQIFVALAHSNVLCWLLIAAASAATGIARERERGLLESLQLSRMSAPGQIAARFAANLLLLGALQLVLLPIYAVAFVMRGISPAEIAGAFFLVFWASVSGTSLGLWFSARSHRPTNALFSALGIIALFSALVYLDGSARFLVGGATGFTYRWLYLFHPSAFFAALSNPNFRWPTIASDGLLFFGAAHLMFNAVLLWGATRNVNRNLSPAAWGHRSVLVDKLRARQAATPPKSVRSRQASGALLADLPLDRFVGFADPLLAREVKSRFRLRRAGLGLSIVRGGLFLLGILVWLWEVFWLFDKPTRAQMAPSGLLVMLFGGALCLAVLSATSWTREREGGTWESLKLSLLTPREILRAKWLSPLVSFAYYSAPLWILLPIGAVFVNGWAFVTGCFIVAAWLGLSVALGLWMSWRVRNGTAAIAWTAGVLAVVLVGLPVLNEAAGVSELLARQKFGVSYGSGAELSMYIYTGQNLDADFLRRYSKDTGRAIPEPINIAAFAPGQPLGIPPEWAAVQQWAVQQDARAARYQARLMAWNPVLTMEKLFDRRQSEYGRQFDETQRDAWERFAWGTLAPTLVTLMLLLLLRRDVRREQLGL